MLLKSHEVGVMVELLLDRQRQLIPGISTHTNMSCIVVLCPVMLYDRLLMQLSADAAVCSPCGPWHCFKRAVQNLPS